MKDVERATEKYLDEIFGEGEGRKHSRFLRHIENEHLREMVHRAHTLEADTTLLSLEENYLLGACVLCVLRSYATAGMFVKTLLHLGVRKEKVLEAIARLAMWIGPIPAAEAAAHVQRAIREYEEKGKESLAAWFPSRGDGPKND